MENKNTKLDHALALARRGFYVFPCKPRDKAPLTPNGHKNATTDEPTIREWWVKWPDANIGLALQPSGLIALDLDRHPGKPDGVEAFNRLKGENTFPNKPPISISGGNGYHIILKKPNRKLKGEMAAGIDVKASGYIILPPSIHPNGNPYTWRDDRSLLDCETPECPEWLLPLILKPETSTEWSGNLPGQYPTSYGEIIIQRCSFMRHVVEDAEILSEPEWYNSIGVLAYTEEVPEIAHKYSSPHPGYSFEETSEKLQHWKKDGKGPPTCRTIQEKCGDDYCKGCPYNGFIKSPIVLGYSARHAERANAPMPFPVDSLPGVFRDFVLSTAMAIQCPVDYVACSLMAVVALLMGGKQRIQLEPEWFQFANLFIALVGSPSSKKSPAMDIAFAPVKAIEKDLYTEYRREMAFYEMQSKSYKAELRKWEKEPSGDPPIEPLKPNLVRLMTSDSTVEALCGLLAENLHGIAIVCDELSGWMRSMNQYKGGQGADRSHYLSMWNNGQITVDRKGKEPIHVQSPYLTLIGGIQPDVLLEMSSQGVEDGLKERFLFSCPPVNTEEPTGGIRIPDSIRNAMAASLRRVFMDRPAELVTIPLSGGAQQAFLSARKEWHRAIRSEGFPGQMEAYFVKMQNYLGRFALILHEMKRTCGEIDSNTIAEDTMQASKALSEYFLSHAHVALGMVMATSEEQRVEKTAKWIQKRGLHVVGPRDLTTHKVAGCRKASQARGMLKALQDYGFGYWNPEKDRLIFFQDSVSISAEDGKQ